MLHGRAVFKKSTLLILALALVSACGVKKKTDGSNDSDAGTAPSAPSDFVVNGEVCPSLHCPSGVFTLPGAGTVTISATVDKDTVTVSSSDATGTFDSSDYTDGEFVFTTTVNAGESREIKFHTANSAGLNSAAAGVTITATPGSLTLAIAKDLTGFAGPRTSNGVTLVGFGASTVRTTWTTVSQSVQLGSGFGNILKGVDP